MQKYWKLWGKTPGNLGSILHDVFCDARDVTRTKLAGAGGPPFSWWIPTRIPREQSPGQVLLGASVDIGHKADVRPGKNCRFHGRSVRFHDENGKQIRNQEACRQSSTITPTKKCQRLRMSWDPNPSKTICRSLSCSISSFERKSQICDDSSRRDFLGLGIDVNCLD